MRFISAFFSISVVSASFISLSSAYAAPTPLPPVTLPPAVQPLDEPLERMAPTAARTEEDEDRLTAAALFSAGRMLEQRDKQSEALRRYQRALRYAPDAKPIMREMLPLAFNLERRDVALRYLADHLDTVNVNDPLLLRAAAEYLAESGDLNAALKIYRQVEQLIAAEKPSSTTVIVQLELGRLNFLKGDFAASAAAFEQVLNALADPKKYGLDAKTQGALAGDDGEMFELMGAVFLEAKRPAEATRAFEQLQKRHADAAVKSLNNARVEVVDGKPQAALDELQKYFTAQPAPKTITPYEVLATTLKALNQSDQLIGRLEKLHQQQPDNAPLAFYLGDEYRQAKRWKDAAKLLSAAIKAKPSAQAYQSLSQVYRETDNAEKMLELLGQVAEQTGSLSVLDSETKAIIENKKLLSAVLTAAKEKHGKAGHDKAGSEDAAVLRATALLASEAKRWDDAETLMDLAIKADSKAAAGLLMAWGLDLFVAAKYDRAGAVFQRGVDDESFAEDQAAFNFYLAGALAMEDKSDAALAAAKLAAKKKSDDPMFLSRPAWILYHAKRYDEAEKAYQEFVDKFDDDFTTPGVREALQQAKIVLSNLNVLKHDTPQAVEYLEQVLDEAPEDAGANNDLGYLWADDGQHLKRAHRMIQLAVADDPENEAFRDSLGWSLFRLGRYAEALVELQKAIDLQSAGGDEVDATVLEHLGDIYEKLGRAGDAQATWKKAIEAYQRKQETDKSSKVEEKLKASEKPSPSAGNP